LEFVVDFSLTDIAGVGTGGSATTGVAAAITNSGAVVGHFGRSPAYAVVTDAAGNILPGDGIVWTSSDATNAPVYASSDPGIAIVGNPNGLGSVSPSATLTATLGALTADGDVYLV
jgi:hypothetical protein